MTIVQLTPGTGGMYCGNCFRDNALVRELRQRGHDVLMVPLYLPLTLDADDASAGTPVFFGGVSVYLEQRFGWFQHAPAWLRRRLASRALLSRAAGHSARTRPEEVGEILLSMLRGEEGRQAVELEELARWLTAQPHPDVVCLSNALLLGLARHLKQRLQTRVVCFLQGEDSYLDALSEPFREPAWQLLREQAREADGFVAPNRYFADLMSRRLGIPSERLHVVPDGIEVEGYPQGPRTCAEGEPSGTASPAILGYFARMCRDKGLHLLVEAFINLRHRSQWGSLRLKVGGGCGSTDEPFVAEMKRQLAGAGLAGEVTFHPNLSRTEKLAFLQSLDVFSVPATYPEAFGLYLLEAMAAGVPVVQPRLAGFTELVEATGGGVLYTPNDATHLANALEPLLANPRQTRELGLKGQRAVFGEFSARQMAARMEGVMRKVIRA